jgi:sugar phosphate isomerase/epimerase
MKLSCQENLVPGATFADRLANLAEWGYEGVELTDFDGLLRSRAAEIKSALADSPVRASTICGGSNVQFIHPVRSRRDESVRQQREILRLCAEFGAIGCIVVPLFNHDPRIPDLDPIATTEGLQRDLLVALMRPLAQEAADLGVCMLLEPLVRYESDFPRDLAEAASICDEVDSPGLKLMADFFHMNVEEADIPASLEAAARHLRHVHLADSNRQVPGRGHTDFVDGFRALRRIGYDGFAALECRIADPPGETLRATAAFLRDCLANSAAAPAR